jgi:hypothetical protein
MEPRGFWKLGDVSNEALLTDLKALLVTGARTDARIVAHLAELDARRLTLIGGISLFEYCTKQLGLSEHEAYFRITAARSARKFPIIFELLERRELHLTAVALLSKYLTHENHFELLAEARGKSKRQLLKMLARRWPKADFTSQVRRLPLEAIAAGPTGSLEYLSEFTHRLEVLLSAEQHDKLELARDLMLHANPSGNLSLVLERALDLLIAHEQKRQFGVLTREQGKGAASGSKRHETEEATADVEPVAQAARQERATVGTSSAEACVVSGAVSTDAEPKATGRKVKYASPPPPNLVRTELPMGPGLRIGRRGHIPNELRRQVLERDGFRCTYTAPDGQRCECTRFLQIHHDHAWAKGGPETLENLRLLCSTHNQLLAELEFGDRKPTGST